MESRKPCHEKNGLKKGPWTAEEDQILLDYIQKHGYGKWRSVPKNAGLKRCGKSCRLRWMNYLRADIKRGNFSLEEEDIIIQLHSVLGNKWSTIASSLPGRTDNEIKNYWNTHIRKKLLRMGIDPVTHRPLFDHLQLSTFLNSTNSVDHSYAATFFNSQHSRNMQFLEDFQENKYFNLDPQNQPHSISSTIAVGDTHIDQFSANASGFCNQLSWSSLSLTSHDQEHNISTIVSPNYTDQFSLSQSVTSNLMYEANNDHIGPENFCFKPILSTASCSSSGHLNASTMYAIGGAEDR